MKLSIVIPAYNEENAIGPIIERTLATKSVILNEGILNDVEVIVVSDGSTDMTEHTAKKYVPNISLIAYKNNKGYGHAIKTGFGAAQGELVAFLDADGTCNPDYFIDMIKKLKETNADICIGSRMGKNSKMPAIRRLGNKIFAFIVNLITSSAISDSASGMRMIKKDKLHLIYPLPDGMNFTPAMTSRALLDHRLSIVEIEMSYEERVGRSKLGVVKDGFGFLKSIISIGITYKPIKLFGPIALLLILASCAYGFSTLGFYLRHGIISDGDIYRLVSVMVFGVSGILIAGLVSMTERAVKIFHGALELENTRIAHLFIWVFSWKRMWIASPLLVISGIILNHQTISSYFTKGIISTHWSYVVTGGYSVLLGIIGFTFGVIDYLFDLIEEKYRNIN